MGAAGDTVAGWRFTTTDGVGTADGGTVPDKCPTSGEGVEADEIVDGDPAEEEVDIVEGVEGKRLLNGDGVLETTDEVRRFAKVVDVFQTDVVGLFTTGDGVETDEVVGGELAKEELETTEGEGGGGGGTGAGVGNL